MIRRPTEGPGRAARATPGRSRAIPTAAPDQSRGDKLVSVIDHLTAAKQAADGIGAKFLAYLLAMAIQETRTEMRDKPTVDRQ